MPSLLQHQSNDFTKLIIMGDPGSGKTGALDSLLDLNLNPRILDLDNGLDSLKAYVLRNHPEKAGQVEYRTLRDRYRATALGPVISGTPRAFVDALKMLERWKYDDVDLGEPCEWGPDCVLVIDSLTLLSDAAFDWAEPLTPRGRSGDTDKRATFGIAQKALEKVLALVTSEDFKTNVIVISHIRYVDTETGRKGYPSSVGEALSPKIGRYFNSMALCQTTAGGKRTIQTAATAMIDLKNPKPFEMEPKYPIETGLADFFRVLRGKPDAPHPITGQMELGGNYAERRVPKKEALPKVATRR